MSTASIDLLVANRRAFVNFVAARVEDRALAEDLVQEGLARAVERAADLRAPEALFGWFHQLLRNAIVDHHRRRASAQRTGERLASETPLAVEPEAPRRPCRCVSRVARELKPEYAEALQRVEVDGVAVKDFGEEAGISSGNAAVRVFRAREALKRKVVTTCGACAAAGCTDCDCTSPAD